LPQLATKYGSQGNVLNDIQDALSSAEDKLPGISDRIVERIVERTTR
jgi:serine/threonine-protein kinase 24/25/MST4